MISGIYKREILVNTSLRKNRPTANQKTQNSKTEKIDGTIFIVENEIKTELQLMVLPTTRRNYGNCRLYDFFISMRRQARQELIEEALRFENANRLIADENVDHCKTLQIHFEKGMQL